MKATSLTVASRLRRAGILVVLGLLVEGVTLGFVHPLALIAFLGLGGGLIIAGMILYLLTLVDDIG